MTEAVIYVYVQLGFNFSVIFWFFFRGRRMENQYESALGSDWVGRVKDYNFNRDGSPKPNNFLLFRRIAILSLLKVY